MSVYMYICISIYMYIYIYVYLYSFVVVQIFYCVVVYLSRYLAILIQLSRFLAFDLSSNLIIQLANFQHVEVIVAVQIFQLQVFRCKINMFQVFSYLIQTCRSQLLFKLAGPAGHFSLKLAFTYGCSNLHVLLVV